jgi:hypothetical protein
MRRWIIGIGVLSLGLAGLPGVARAQYRPSPRREEPPEAETFDDAVSLKRFRKGNIGWDTQELIASGMKALHEEQLRILKKLDRIESRLNELEKSLGDLEGK